MEDEDYILFDQYLTGELSAEEINAFEEKLKTNTTFASQFNVYKDVHSHLQNTIENEAENDAFKKNLTSISESYFSQAKNKPVIKTIAETKKKSNIFRIGQLAMAASVLIFAGIFAFNQFANPVYSDYNSHEPIDLTVRGSENEMLKQATDAFNSKDFEKAALLFNKILNFDPSNLEIELYKSIALIELENYGEADELLWMLSETDSAYKNKAKWYWALSKLKQQEFEECVKILKTIPSDADDYNEAKKLIDKLD